MSTTPDANHTSPLPGSVEAHDRRLDNQLAELADALLSGQNVNAAAIDPELNELVKVSRGLKTLIADDPGPSAAFRAQLSRTLTEEWDKERFRRRTNWPRLVRFAALAAALVVVLGAVGLFLNSSPEAGLAAGPLTPQFFAVVAVIGAGVIVALIIFALSRRK